MSNILAEAVIPLIIKIILATCLLFDTQVSEANGIIAS